MKKIGDRIKERREELEMTADELALKINKDRATIYRYERNQIANLPVNVIEPLAKALNTTPDYLIGWTDDKEIHEQNNYSTSFLSSSIINSSIEDRSLVRLLSYMLKLKRLNNSSTEKEFADKLGITLDSYFNIENSIGSPKNEDLDKIIHSQFLNEYSYGILDGYFCAIESINKMDVPDELKKHLLLSLEQSTLENLKRVNDKL